MKHYIITSVSNDSKKGMQYMAYDSRSSGYPYWTNSLHSAVQFDTPDSAAAAILNDCQYISKAIDVKVVEVATTFTQVAAADSMVMEQYNLINEYKVELSRLMDELRKVMHDDAASVARITDDINTISTKIQNVRRIIPALQGT